MPDSKKKLAWSETTTWVAVAVSSLVWWGIASHGSWQRLVLVVSLSLASFMVGSIAGFLFTSYGEETATVGKIRDWLIGGLTGLTIAKAGTIKALLLLFAAGPGPAEFAFALGNAILYAGTGFYFMFFQRELIFNVLLAKTRAERVKLEGTQQATTVVQQLLIKLPPSVLSGVDSIGETDIDADETTRLKGLLYSDDVEKFLGQAEEAARSGQLDWDVTSKAAYIHYYRTYFEEKNREAETSKASEWIVRALNMNPLHMDLTMKYAEMLGNNKDYESTVAILERLVKVPEAPLIVREWLGFYLRYLPGRLDDAIRYSREYHQLFPEETDSLFNIAYAFAGKYCEELRVDGIEGKYESENRKQALSFLREALLDQPEMIQTVKRWTEPGRPFNCLLHDHDFRTIIRLPAEDSRNEDSEPVPSISDAPSAA